MSRTVDNPVAVSYTPFEHPKVKDFVCIRVDEGEFEGVVFHYENVKVDDETSMLNFNYHLIESFIAEEMLIDGLKLRLEDTVAGILYDILIKQLGRVGNEDRADDSKESDSQ
jgi:hypothetical protein